VKYKSYLDHAASIGRKRAPVLGIQTGIYMFMIYAAYALAFWYGIHLFAKGEAQSSGKVITTLFSIIIGTNAFAQLAGYFGSFLRISTAGVELLKVIDEPSAKTSIDSRNFSFHSRPPSSMGPSVDRDEDEDIEFTDVTFSYPLRPGIPVLKNFSLTIRAGKMTALIGPSGSGKSTIVGLLERWYCVDEGIIRLGSTNVDNFPATELRGKIGLVQQVAL
jgi:ATP-binding cassette subfamily B (MDR/TAP) protein 1